MAAGDDLLRDQEAALIKLGRLYRDEKCVEQVGSATRNILTTLPLD
jgi:hypothetical protein